MEDTGDLEEPALRIPSSSEIQGNSARMQMDRFGCLRSLLSLTSTFSVFLVGSCQTMDDLSHGLGRHLRWHFFARNPCKVTGAIAIAILKTDLRVCFSVVVVPA